MAVYAILELTLAPDKVDGSDAVIHELLIATRGFAGNLGVDVYVDQSDPAHVFIYEKWESPEADSAYRAWRTTPEGANDLGTLLAKPPAATLLTLAEGV